MTKKRDIERLREAIERIPAPLPEDLSRLDDDERASWAALVAKLPRERAVAPATGLEALTDDEFLAFERLHYKLADREHPGDAITYGHYCIPPVGHPQRAAYERGELGYGPDDPNGYPRAAPVPPKN